MIRPCIFLLLALLALLGAASARQMTYVAASLPNQIQQSQFLATSRNNVAKCFGLARKSRTRNLQVPVLYNSVSGQTAAVPDYLFSLDDRTIDKMEAEGWEVRMKTMLMPDTYYQRVPVCCPWDTACYHNQLKLRGLQMPQTASSSSGCLNGGVSVTRGRIQVCVCPAGFKGTRCQIPPSMMTSSSFPSGPVIPYRKVVPSTADVISQAVKQAQIWREKMMSSRQPPVFVAGRPMTKGPLLSPNDHVLTSINKHWAQQNPSEKAMRMKMAMLVNLYLKQQAERLKNLPKARLPPMLMSPMRFPTKANQVPRIMNPYSSGPSQPFVNPQMVSMINHLQGRSRVPAALNPYGMNAPQARTPWNTDPWESQQVAGRDQAIMGGPSMSHGRGQTVMGGPSMSNGREKLMALAFAQYVRNLQRRLASTQANGGMMTTNMTPQINRRVPIREPPMSDMDQDYASNPGMMDPRNINKNEMPSVQSDLPRDTTDLPNHITDDPMTSLEMPRPVGGRGDLNQQFVNQGGARPITSQQMPMVGMDLNGRPLPQGMNPMDEQMLQGMPIGAGRAMPMNGGAMPMGAGPGGAMPKMPSQEELQRMTECRVVLEPRISMCIKDAGHELSLEEFMNPQFMSNARGVCQDSETVGQCVMRQDQTCGEGTAIEMTRKMIDSVLQMMAMVCGQIAKMDQQQGINQQPIPGVSQTDNTPHLTTLPQGINIQRHTSMPVGEAPTPTTAPTLDKRNDDARPSEPSKSSDKFTTSKIGAAVTGKTPNKAANKGHHSVEPVTADTFIPGAPLWLVIVVAGVVLLTSCLCLILIALVVRRRRVYKSKEIERKADPMDSKLYTIGILPPPHYATTSIKTQDELTLPPLDLAENAQDSDDGNSNGGQEEDEDDVQKPAVSDDDADDESDDKEDSAEKKKKEKKEKK